MSYETQSIATLNFGEIEAVRGGFGLFVGLVTIAAALVYAGEIIHDLTCDDHD